MSFWRSAVLVGLTVAIVGWWLPSYLQRQPPILVRGTVAPGFERVQEAFRHNFESGRDSPYGGSAYSVYHKGVKVVDLWGGYADLESNQEWKEDTISLFFSATKGVAAICLAMLVDRGQLDYDQTVSHYWPEFAQKGKATITVRQLLEHQAGLALAAPPGLSIDLLRDVAKAGELMASTEPLWEVDGKTHGYHAITYGPLVNELLRRADPKHRTLGHFFADEVAKPLGLDFYSGVPLAENYRVARLTRGLKGFSFSVLLQMFFSSPVNRQAFWHMLRDDLVMRMILNANIGDLTVFNDPYIRQVDLPSAGGTGSARSMAKLFGVLATGGRDQRANVTLLSQKTLDKLFTSGTPTLDKALGIPVDFNVGMMALNITDGHIGFGHPGAGGQIGIADPQNSLGFAFTSTTMYPFFALDAQPRATALFEATYQSIQNLSNK